MNNSVSEELILLCQQNNRSAQIEFYDEFSGIVMSVCKRYTYSDDLAEDIFQESFIHLFNNIEKFDITRGIASFIPWLKKTVSNIALQQLRKDKKFKYHEEIEDTIVDTSTTPDENFNAEQIICYLRELPDLQKNVFNMYAIEGYSHAEISEQLDISLDNSRTCLTRARKKLAQLIKNAELVD